MELDVQQHLLKPDSILFCDYWGLIYQHLQGSAKRQALGWVGCVNSAGKASQKW